MRTNAYFRYLVCGAISVLYGPYALAQSVPANSGTAGNTLEEVVVTARKRAELALDVPVAIVTIPAEMLANNLATNLSTVAELAPQVVIGRGINGTGAVLTIRGISSTSSDSGIDQSVSVVIDDVPLSRGRVISASVYDLQQIEVMEGPQALFFGKNSPAGVISLRSADPINHFEGHVKAGYEFEAKERYVEGVVSGPLTDTFGARLAVRYSNMDGWIENVAQPIANPFQPTAPLPGAWDDTMPKGYDEAARLTLLWKPSADFQAKFKLTFDKESLNSNGAYGEGFCISPTTVPVELGVPMTGADCQQNMIKAESAVPAQFAVNFPYANGGVPYSLSQFTLASLDLDKTFDHVTLSSVTGYYNQLLQAAHTSDFSPLAQAYNVERERYEIWTEELRLNSDFSGPVNFMVGAYIERATRDWFGAPDIQHVFNPVAQNYTTAMLNTYSNNDNESAFAQLRWKINPAWELTGGARYTKDKKETTYLNSANNPNSATGRTLYPTGQLIDLTLDDHNTSPEATITWKPEPNQAIYAAYKTGYKPGGMSNPVLLPATATAQSLTFGPEKSSGYEVGYKMEILDHRLRADIVVYRYNYDGLQVAAFDPVLLRLKVGNAAYALTKGITASFNWLATNSLSLRGNVGYNRARYEQFPGAQCYTGQTPALGCVGGFQDLSGQALNRAPDVTFTVGADYKINLMQDWLADLSISGTHSDSYQAQTDYGPGGVQPSYWLLNAAVHLGPHSEKYQFSLIGRNLTNSYYMAYSAGWPFGGLWQYVGTFNRPREVALEATYRFQ